MSARFPAALVAAIAIYACTTAAEPAAAGAVQERGLWAPMELARVTIGQRKLEGRITFSLEQDLSPTKQLKLYPKWINRAGKHLCVAIDGKAASRRLLCPGGPVSNGAIQVGVSRYRRNGSATKLHGFSADFERRSKHSIRLSFPLRRGDLRPGRFRYFAASTWRSPECVTAARSGKQKRRRAGGRRNRPELGQCRDRLPSTGRLKGRIYKVQRVGCTTGDRGAFTNGPRDRPRVALTFDDGPSAYTAQILDSLDSLGAKGTFFETGYLTGGYSSLMRKIIAHGHEIGNHSYSHEFYPGSSSMRSTNQAIEAATRFQPCVFRPPYGAYSSATVAAARENGMSTVLWDIDTNDWRQPGTGAIYGSAVQARPGSIVLMHDGGGSRGQTVAAVPDIVRTLRSRGYRLVTVTELMGGRFKLREKH